MKDLALMVAIVQQMWLAPALLAAETPRYKVQPGVMYEGRGEVLFLQPGAPSFRPHRQSPWITTKDCAPS